jgi:hypothetical protein
MGLRKLSAAAATGLVALGAPAAASAAITPLWTRMPASAVPAFLATFVPPKVGAISVDLGATIINGQVMAPPVHVLMPGVTVAPFTWAWPPIR